MGNGLWDIPTMTSATVVEVILRSSKRAGRQPEASEIVLAPLG